MGYRRASPGPEGATAGKVVVARDIARVVQGAIDFHTFTVPVDTLIVFVVAAVIAGLIAAIFPARRAARLNVLEALQYE